jgi:hypothetical protein
MCGVTWSKYPPKRSPPARSQTRRTTLPNQFITGRSAHRPMPCLWLRRSRGGYYELSAFSVRECQPIVAPEGSYCGCRSAFLGQDLSIGAIGGGSLTDAAQIRTWSQSKDWIAGATFELRFRSLKSQSMIRSASHGGVKVTTTGVQADGKPGNSSYTAKYDPVAGQRSGSGSLPSARSKGPNRSLPAGPPSATAAE